MKHSVILALTTALIFTGCKSGGSNNSVYSYHPGSNAHYMITPKVMKGECDAPEALVFVIWKGEIHTDGIHGDLDITGLVSGFDVAGIATDEDGNQFVFDALLSQDASTMRGEWYSTAGDCEGPLNGVRI